MKFFDFISSFVFGSAPGPKPLGRALTEFETNPENYRLVFFTPPRERSKNAIRMGIIIDYDRDPVYDWFFKETLHLYEECFNGLGMVSYVQAYMSKSLYETYVLAFEELGSHDKTKMYPYSYNS